MYQEKWSFSEQRMLTHQQGVSPPSQSSKHHSPILKEARHDAHSHYMMVLHRFDWKRSRRGLSRRGHDLG